MRAAYSPPVTRQRARALFIAEVAQKEQRGQKQQQEEEEEEKRAKKEEKSSAAAAAAGKGRSGSRSRLDAKELLATKRGRGTDFKPTRGGRADFKPTQEPRRGARRAATAAASNRNGSGGSGVSGNGRARPLSSRTADLRPVRHFFRVACFRGAEAGGRASGGRK